MSRSRSPPARAWPSWGRTAPARPRPRESSPRFCGPPRPSFKSRGGTLVVATHSFDAGLGVADRVAILSGGRIVLDRHAAELDRGDVHRLYDELALGPGTAS